MKEYREFFKGTGLWVLLAGVLAISSAAVFFIAGYNWAGVWALYAASSDGLLFRAEYQLWKIKREVKRND